MAVPQNKRREFLNALKPCYLDYIWQQTLKAEGNSRSAHKTEQAQILLIHANILNAYVLPDIINLYKQHGYTFVSLDKALKSTTEPSTLQAKVKKTKTNSDSLFGLFLAWD